MNKRSLKFVVLFVFLLGCILYAFNREFVLANYVVSSDLGKESIDIVDKKTEEVHNKESSEKKILSTSNTILFTDDFEGATSKWTFVNSADNEWYIGAAISNSGTKSAYVSSDKGLTNTYKSKNNVSFILSDIINIPNNIVDVNLKYDWRCLGEVSSSGFLYDYGQVWIMPSTFVPSAGTMIKPADGGVLVNNKLAEQTAFKSENQYVDISKLSGKSVKIVFQWRDDGITDKQPPLAIDNVTLSILNCQGPTSFSVDKVTSNSISVNWTTAISGTTVELYNSTMNVAPTVAQTGTVTSVGTSYIFSGLSLNASYYLWYRVICNASEKSEWKGPILVKTPCLPQALPFSEGFNSNSTTSVCWSNIDVKNDATSPTGSNIWRISTSSAYEGNQAMYFSGNSSIEHDDWLISPTFNLTGGTYKLSYYYRTSSLYDNEFEVLLSTNGPAIDLFTTTLVPKSKYNTTTYIKKEVYLAGITGDVNIAWHVLTSGSSTVYIDKVELTTVACTDIESININKVTTNSVNFDIVDKNNTQWEYGIVAKGSGIPKKSGIVTTSKSISATTTIDNNVLIQNTEYELYVRSKCGTSSNYNDWIGPVLFRTECGVSTLPFEEGFNKNSNSLFCWTVNDVNNDATSPTGNNLWRVYNYGMYEGDQTMYFYGASGKDHNDWLISPTFNLTGGWYKLSYYYKTTSSNSNDYEVLLSKNGVNPSAFTTVLVPKSVYNTTDYVRKDVYIHGITGDINIAWHVETSNSATVYIDKVELKSVDCTDIENISIVSTTKNSVNFDFIDVNNATWEYGIVAKGAAPPIGAGVNTSVKNVTTTTDNNNKTLIPDTEYDLYIRAKCGTTSNFNAWVGPIKFRTKCDTQILPFSEGFNKTSSTLTCWTILDNTGSITSATGSNVWKITTSGVQEGNQAMYYSGTTTNHDGWLITPKFNLNSSKTYKLSYYYKGSTYEDNQFEVRLSKTGIKPTDFTDIIVIPEIFKNGSYLKKDVYLRGYNGEVNLAWHVIGDKGNTIYLDLVTVEEVNCIDPINIVVNNVTKDSAELKWDDSISSSWEYYIQVAGGTKPTGNGTPITTTTVIANNLANGGNLLPNTDYEYYVRSKCLDGNMGNWFGPIKFRTLCDVQSLPFIETFETTSTSVNCWTSLNLNNNATSPTGNDLWRINATTGVTGRGMYFYGSSGAQHNDWLISPTIKLDANSAYRLVYYYKTNTYSSDDNTFSVKLSTTGINPANFTTTLVPPIRYSNSSYVKEVVYINGISGDVNIGWYIGSKGYAVINIDDVSIEKIDCVPPKELDVTNVTINSATLKWNDTNSTSWEYWIQPKGGAAPTANGVLTSTNPVIATKDYKGDNLNPGTLYEFYVRSKCTKGGESPWEGPKEFFTACSNYNSPFNETFNSDSNSLRCWTIKDSNNDATSSTGSNIWRPITSGTHQGDQAMYFSGLSTVTQHDDWLISPVITLTGKMYKVSYQYKTGSTNDNDFEFMMSKNGTDFTGATTLISKQKVNQVNYTEEVVYVRNTSGNVHFGFHVSAKKGATIYIDTFSVEEVSCADPLNIVFSNTTSNSVDVSWTDKVNSHWEYIVQDIGEPLPTGSGDKINNKSVVLSTLTGTNIGLQPQTSYEVYIRSDCGNENYSNWQGPFTFKTGCANVTLPFDEGFDTTSKTVDCWQIVDGNNDSTSPTGSNIWKISNTGGVTGRSMYFSGTTSQHNDWLISPTFTFAANTIYQITYKYKTSSSSSYENRFAVKLSKAGMNTTNFTEIVVPTNQYVNSSYITEVAYYQMGSIGGNVNISWHVEGSKSCSIYLDDISIKQVGCISPKQEDVKVSNITSGGATVSWIDNVTSNTSYNYYIQAVGGATPIAGGSNTNAKAVNITQINTPGGGNLQPDTEYEFYFRSICGTGKYSDWVGPIQFRTKCSVLALPFWEGFNTTSTTARCWTYVDDKGIENTLTTSGKWNIYGSSLYAFEGDRSVRFYGGSSTVVNNDWLISPSFTMVASKYYRLRYHYSGSTSYKGNLKIALSTTGANIAGMTTIIDPMKQLDKSTYQEENLIFKGLSGTVNIGFYANTPGYSTMYIDNVFVEEVQGCPEPSDLGVKDEKPNNATIFWDQKFEGSEWEYYVQLAGGKTPAQNATGGVKVKTKQVIADKDAKGNSLKNNTEYEFYVRTVCNATANSIWVGPFKFMTTCGVFNSPFVEEFDEGSTSLRCWTIIDNNKDATNSTGNNIWRSTKSVKYDGSQAMEFNGATGRTHDDWLISPTIKFDVSKTYRVKYYYRTSGITANKNEFELLLSKTGVGVSDFTSVIKQKQVYENTTQWKEEYLFVSGYSGDINLAFHVLSTGATNIYVDKFSVEEVLNCPEPLQLEVNNITHNEATISWVDNLGANKFEYFVQEQGKIAPRLNDKGVPIMGKTVIATKDIRAKANLLPNTTYEFYVRTNCGNGTYSIWSGPMKFTTLCAIYPTPFTEGFNAGSELIRCWSVLDPSNNGTTTGSNLWSTIDTKDPFEGDRHASYIGTTGKLHNAWLISPTLDLDGGQYVLKYRYKTTAVDNNEFEVLLSTSGITPTSFTKTVVTKKVYKNAYYVEEVAFINNVKGAINLAWHITTNGKTTVYLDKVELKKYENCPEPSKIETTNSTKTSFDVKWQENGTATSWEVTVVPAGKPETGTPIQTKTVSTTPSTSFTNLPSGRMYSIFVRSICTDGKSKSNWSSDGRGYTSVNENDECKGAITLQVNNTMDDCTEKFTAVTEGITKSKGVAKPCWPSEFDWNSWEDVYYEIEDLWFEFTATQPVHAIKVNNLVNLKTGTSKVDIFYIAVYEVGCNAITDDNAKWCGTVQSNDTAGFGLDQMIPGKKYLVRIGIDYNKNDKDRHSFDICIGGYHGNYLKVTPSQPTEPGDPDSDTFVPDPAKPYTIDKLVKNVLVNSNCKLVSNVKYQNGDGSAKAMSYNTIGYFNKGKTDFPFEEGIVLATNEVQYVPGPAQPSSFDKRGNNTQRWTGDKDINDAINDAGGGPYNDKRVTQLEFDFVPIKEVLKFEYLFASNSYHSDCSSVKCQAGALFAAWLIDLETGKGVNLAKVNGTDTPIALNTVVDHNKTKKSCTSMNPELYWKHYDNRVDNNLSAYVDFVGLTKAMSSDEMIVVPGRKYHIKLAVIDFCKTTEHTSAAFFKAGSFDLGDLDLGADLTIKNNNAICNAESRTIQTGLGTDNVDIKWFKDDVEIVGENKPDLTVKESGKYRVEAFYKNIKCPVKGEIVAEIYPAISKIVGKAEDVSICRYSLEAQQVNLQTVLDKMFAGVDSSVYFTQAYRTLEDLEFSNNEIKELSEFKIIPSDKNEMVYFRVEDKRSGCMEIFPLTIKLQEGEKPTTPKDVNVCDSYTLPDLPANQKYYSQAGAQGENYASGHVFKAGVYDVYILQDNGNNGCYEETKFRVEVTEKPLAQQLDDVNMSCELYELRDLKDNSKYYIEVNGNRVEVLPGTIITTTNTRVYIVRKSENGVCVDETSFFIVYEDCPIPKGFSPNGDGVNDVFDLSQHGATSVKIFNRNGSEVFTFKGIYTNQWTGKDKSNKDLPSGTYYYVIEAFGKTRTGWVQINR